MISGAYDSTWHPIGIQQISCTVELEKYHQENEYQMNRNIKPA